MKRKEVLLAMAGSMAVALGCFGREKRPELLVDVDFFDNVESITPYCGAEWIDSFFATCKSNGVKRATWRCQAQIANYPSKLNYNLDQVGQIRSAADERRFDGAFAAKVGVAPQVGRKLPELAGLDFGGIAQKIMPPKGSHAYTFRGFLSAEPLPPQRGFSAWCRRLFGPEAQEGAFLAAVDAQTGRVLGKSENAVTYPMQRYETQFTASAPFYVGAFSRGSRDIHVFVADNLSLTQVGKPDTELLKNGDMERVDKFMELADWAQTGANFVTLNGDASSLPDAIKKNDFPNLEGFNILRHPYKNREPRVTKAAEDGDSLALAGRAAKKYGIELYAWFDPFDDGRKCLPPVKVWSSRFLEEHPECRCTDKDGHPRWGLLCFACPEVRAYKTAVIKELLAYEGVTGVALKTHYQHNILWGLRSDFQDECVYHPLLLAEYDAKWGKPKDGAYNLFLLKMLNGNAVMQWLREIRPLFPNSQKRLCMFEAPYSFLDRIGTSGWYLPPEAIIKEKLCDDILIEPRWNGDHVGRFQKNSHIHKIIAKCRKAGVGVGFDYYYTSAFRQPEIKDRGAYLHDQVTALAKEDLDFIGIYEEMNIHSSWQNIAQTAKDIQALPATTPATVVKESTETNLFTFESCTSITLKGATGNVVSASELLINDDRPEGICVPCPPVELTITLKEPLAISGLALSSGQLNWKCQCHAEDFTVEGFDGKNWKRLADVKNAFAARGKDNQLPSVCRFPKTTLTQVRITISRSENIPRFLVLRNIKAM